MQTIKLKEKHEIPETYKLVSCSMTPKNLTTVEIYYWIEDALELNSVKTKQPIYYTVGQIDEKNVYTCFIPSK